MENYLNKVLSRASNRMRRMGIFNRLMVSFFLIIVLSNIIVGYAAFYISSQKIDENTIRKSYQILSNVNKIIDEKLEYYEEISYQLYNNKTLRELLSECKQLEHKGQRTSQKYLENQKKINSILYNTNYGNSIYPEKWLLNMQIITEYDQFVQESEGDTIRGAYLKEVSDYYHSENVTKTKEYFGISKWYDTSKENNLYFLNGSDNIGLGNYLTLMRTIPDINDNEDLGVIVLNVSLDLIINIFKSNDLSIVEGNILLVGDSGIITYFNTNLSNGYIKLDNHVISDIYESKIGNIKERKDGKEYNVIFLRSESTDWILAAVVENTLLVQEIYSIRDIILKVSFICVVIAAFISYLVTSSISKPINNLKEVMLKVGRGDMGAKYNDNSKDEIGVLGQMFNGMLGKIQTLINTVYEVELIKKNEEIKRKEAELDALQMQINPHFIYNTLDIIKWESINQQDGENTVSEMIVAFSNFLRLGTKNTKTMIAIREELAHVEAYLKVFQIKTGNAIHFNAHMEDNIILTLKTVKLILQPIIENAVIHGFAIPSKDDRIDIFFKKNHDQIEIEIKDNGCGIEKDLLEVLVQSLNSTEKNDGHIGLKNVNERIKLNFGDQFGMAIKSQKDVYTSVILTIPIIE